MARFRFSLKDLFVSTALIAGGLGCISFAVPLINRLLWWRTPLLFFSAEAMAWFIAPILIGTGIGTLFHRKALVGSMAFFLGVAGACFWSKYEPIAHVAAVIGWFGVPTLIGAQIGALSNRKVAGAVIGFLIACVALSWFLPGVQ